MFHQFVTVAGNKMQHERLIVKYIKANNCFTGLSHHWARHMATKVSFVFYTIHDLSSQSHMSHRHRVSAVKRHLQK